MATDQSRRSERVPIKPQDAYVLVVEDRVANFVLVARLLAFAGFEHCEWKMTGWGVVDFVDTMPRLDLVLMDLRLPHENGYEALAALRAHQQLCRTPVVAITAQANREEMERARRAGFDGFLTKPLDIDKFPDQIIRILEGEEIWELGS